MDTIIHIPSDRLAAVQASVEQIKAISRKMQVPVIVATQKSSALPERPMYIRTLKNRTPRKDVQWFSVPIWKSI